MNVIKKHPAALLVCLSLVIMGIPTLLVVGDDNSSDLAFAILGLSFVLSAAVLVAAAVVAVVRMIRSRRRPVNVSWNFIGELARDYMLRTPFGSAYWIIVILLSPVTPVVLVHVLDNYMPGYLLISLGLMIFLLCASRDILAQSFFVRRGTQRYFSMESGDDPELLRSIYGDLAHVYLVDSWDEAHMDFIYNLLRRQNGLPDTVRCFKVSGECVSRTFGIRLSDHFAQFVLVPFSQFELTPKSRDTVRHFTDRLSIVRFTTLINSQYGRKRSLEPEDYLHHGGNRALRTYAASINAAGRFDSELRIAVNNACGAEEHTKIYLDCLIVVKNARHDGTEETAKLEQRLLCADPVYLEEADISDHIMTLRLIIDDDIDAENWTQSEEEYSPLHTLCYEFDSIEWHWDSFCDTSREMEMCRRANTESK